MSIISTRSTKSHLPKTGRTTSHRTGDDGDIQSGSDITPRFINNDDGTVTDRVTNLMWVQNPATIIPGASVVPSNQIQVAKGNWVNATHYNLADVVYNTPTNNKQYICVVDHTSIADAPQGVFAENHAYSLGDIIREGSNFLYWACLVPHTSYQYNAGTWWFGNTYAVGDIVQDPYTSKYHRCTVAHSTPAAYQGSTNYDQTWYVGDIVKDDYAGQGWGICLVEHGSYFVPGWYTGNYYYGYWDKCTPDYENAYVCQNGYYDYGEGFSYWANQGYWTRIGYTGFEFDCWYFTGYATPNTYWTVCPTIIDLDNAINGTCWSAGYDSVFLLEKALNSTYWTASTDLYSFAYELSNYPTYWVETLWLRSNQNLLSPRGHSWNDAIDMCAALDYAGYSDWRLPNLLEFLSARNLQRGDLRYPDFFPDLIPVEYASYPIFWTSTYTMYHGSNAGVVDYNNGNYPHCNEVDDAGPWGVWPVRTIK